MKIVILHGLGQTAKDWNEVTRQLSVSDIDCPELFSDTNDISYLRLLTDLERQYADGTEPLCICGLSLGAILALDFAIRHEDKVCSLILIGAQYKVPRFLIDFQNLLFHCMPNRSFANMGISKKNMIKLSHSMRTLDFTSQLAAITCPAAIVCGEKDSANLKASRELAELLPQAKLHIIPGAGHEANKTAPQDIAAILNEQTADMPVHPASVSFFSHSASSAVR